MKDSKTLCIFKKRVIKTFIGKIIFKIKLYEIIFNIWTLGHVIVVLPYIYILLYFLFSNTCKAFSLVSSNASGWLSPCNTIYIVQFCYVFENKHPILSYQSHNFGNLTKCKTFITWLYRLLLRKYFSLAWADELFCSELRLILGTVYYFKTLLCQSSDNGPIPYRKYI